MAFHLPKSLSLLALLFYIITGVIASTTGDPPVFLLHQRRTLENPPISKRSNISSSAIKAAEELAAQAVAQQSAYNAYRVVNPRRNTYISRHSNKVQSSRSKRINEPTPPSLNSTLRAAAVLLAERDAAQQLANGTLHQSYNGFNQLPNSPLTAKTDSTETSSSFWASQVSHGQPPMGYNSSYPVYRDVTAFGAKGDGVTDDTDAINEAISSGGNCGEGCLSSSVKGTFVFFPPGTYLISSPINAYYYSQLVGDPNDLPVIKTSASFIGLGAIQSDVYIPGGNGDEWYIEQSNFYRQVRNFVIDITQTTVANAAGLHWQIAQATSLTNVFIVASKNPATTQMGIFTENGSGGFMSGCSIIGGQYGIYGGNQQYTVRDFSIVGQTNSSICLIWDWGWTWSHLYLSEAPIGINLINPQDPTGQQGGSTYIMDTQFVDTPTAISANFAETTILESSIITLDNIEVSGVSTIVAFTDGSVLDLPAENIDFVVIGNIKDQDGSSFGSYAVDVQSPPSSLLNAGGSPLYRPIYFTKDRPQYEALTLESIISVTDHGAVGDGKTDDTSAIASALALATTNNLIYFPPGSYMVTSTIVIPAHARITGQVWSQIVASGPYFADLANPKAMIQVGNVGDVGTVEISDLLFTSVGELPGLVLMEWNVQAEEQGSVGIWDAHFRVGGAYGSELQVAQCLASGTIQTACVAASMVMYITPGSNGYFENMWLWVADHDIDVAENTQITVAVSRGLLIDSTEGPTWMYGTASEHSILYQYNFVNTTDTFAGMIQTESPYYQFADATESPGPFNSSVGLFANDPIFPDSSCTATPEMCNFAWAVIMEGNTNLTIAGAGLYSWYDNYLETCVDTQNCQQRLVLDAGGNYGLYLFNLITIGSVEMISNIDDNQVVLAKNNTQAIGHPLWSALASYLDDYQDLVLSCTDDSTDPACQAQWNCNLTRTYATVDDLNSAAGSFPNQCMGYYALGTLYTTLNASLANYTQANAGYDDVFGDYVTYTKELVPEILTMFMAGSSSDNPQGGGGNKYFNCTCEGYGPTLTQQCPFAYTQLLGATSYVMTYTLIDADGFYNDLQTNYAINRTWVTFGDSGGPTHQSGGHCLPGDCSEGTDYRYVNIPQAVSASKMDVLNPKDVITSALPQISQMKNNLLARQLDVNLGQWNGSFDDLLQTFSMPIFMIQQAVDSMATVKSIGEKEAREKKIQLILEILGIAFAFIPFLDDLAPELEALDGVFNTISTIGNLGLGIESIVSDPSSAPMALLGLLAGGKLRSDKDFEAAAAARRSLTDDDLENIGSKFQETDSKFQNTIKPSCRT